MSAPISSSTNVAYESTSSTANLVENHTGVMLGYAVKQITDLKAENVELKNENRVLREEINLYLRQIIYLTAEKQGLLKENIAKQKEHIISVKDLTNRHQVLENKVANYEKYFINCSV